MNLLLRNKNSLNNLERLNKDQFYFFLLFLMIIMFLSTANILSQQDSLYKTNEVVVTASRYEENINLISKALTLVSNDELELSNPINVANALNGKSGLWMQQTNHGGGSPFLRGFTGNQTLIMIDGIRLNNSTFRYGPNQYLNTISIHNIQRIEILRGSGSVQYGSDALGGIVHLITKSPQIGLSKELDAGIQLKYLTDNMEQSTNAFINYSTKNSAYHASLSFKKLGDLIAGGNLGKEAPSSYNELSLNIKNVHMLADSLLFTYNYQFVKQDDVDRFDQVNQRGYEYYKFDPQIRHLAYIKNEYYSGNKLAKKISMNISWQQSSETRLFKKRNDQNKITYKDEIDTWGTSLNVISQPQNNWIINTGAEYYFDIVQSNSSVTNLANNTISNRRGLYADDSKSHNFSVFTISNLELRDFNLGFGARYNIASLIISDDVFGKPNINPNAFTWDLSLTYKLTDYFRLNAQLNSAYRIPNINDVSSFGFFDYGIEVPNNKLLPERSLNYELGFKLNTPNIRTSLSLFRSNLKNLIDRVEATYNGETTFNGEQIYKKVNMGEAYIEGIEFEIESQIINNFYIEKNITYTFGQNITKDEPMRRIPPLNGSLSILYYPTVYLDLKIQYLYAFKQNRLSSGDIDDHRIDDEGTPGWKVLNIYSNYKFGFFDLGLGINNLFNEAYRMHGSGIDGVGRSFQIIGKYRI